MQGFWLCNDWHNLRVSCDRSNAAQPESAAQRRDKKLAFDRFGSAVSAEEPLMIRRLPPAAFAHRHDFIAQRNHHIVQGRIDREKQSLGALRPVRVVDHSESAGILLAGELEKTLAGPRPL